MMDTQCRLLADICTGRVELPDAQAMRKDVEREKREIRVLYPDRPRYELELEPVEYRKQVAHVQREFRRAATGAG